jgi:hypothetical protein
MANGTSVAGTWAYRGYINTSISRYSARASSPSRLPLPQPGRGHSAWAPIWCSISRAPSRRLMVHSSLTKRAGAWCNGEVAYIAWDVEEEVKDCVGFMGHHTICPKSYAKRSLPDLPSRLMRGLPSMVGYQRLRDHPFTGVDFHTLA